jgi:Zn ribbon nucleic-acid-binding protein
MFKENDIRPLDLKSKQIKCIKEDVDYLLKRKNRFVNVSCPVCSKNNNVKFIKSGFKYIECVNCTMLYISPRPTFKILKDFYSNSVNYKFFNDYIFPASEETRRKKNF